MLCQALFALELLFSSLCFFHQRTRDKNNGAFNFNTKVTFWNHSPENIDNFNDRWLIKQEYNWNSNISPTSGLWMDFVKSLMDESINNYVSRESYV